MAFRHKMSSRTRLRTVTSLFPALLMCLPLVNAASNRSFVSVESGWELRWGDSPLDSLGTPLWSQSEHEPTSDWEPVSFPAPKDPFSKESSFLWLRIRLPDTGYEFQQPAVLFSSPFQAVELYFGGQRLLTVGNLEPGFSNRFNYLNWYTAALPRDFHGEYLFLRVFSESRYAIGLSNRTLRVGEHQELIKAMVWHHGDTFVFGGLFVLIGLFVLFLAAKRRDQNLWLYLCFSAFVTCTGLFFVSINSVSQLFFDTLWLRYYLGYLAFLLLPVGLFAFYEQVSLRYRVFFRRIWQFHAVLAVAALAADLLSVFDLFYSRFVVVLLLPLDLILLLILGAQSARRGNREAKTLNFGFSALGVLGLHDFLISFGLLPDWHHLFGWGALILVLTLGYILEQRFTENHEQVKAYSQELETASLALQTSNRKLEEVNRTLEERVRERTRDLNDKNGALEIALRQLQDAQQRLVLQEKMASLGNLVAGVAHEINTPLGAVASSADTSRRSLELMEELLRESQSLPELQVDAKFQKALETLQNSQDITTSASGRISTIVKSLKDFARLDESARQVADLNSALTTTLALLQHELHERITVVRHLGKLPPVHCYLSQVNQVLMNLLLNASQAIEGQGRITVSTRHQGDTVSISIADTGTGIPADNLTRIFDPGFTTKGVGVGTGLGLSTSYRIIKDHGGEIEVQSTPGEGSVFTIRLPLRSSNFTPDDQLALGFVQE